MKNAHGSARLPLSLVVYILWAAITIGGGIWLRMQTAHDLWIAERDTDISMIRKLQAA